MFMVLLQHTLLIVVLVIINIDAQFGSLYYCDSLIRPCLCDSSISNLPLSREIITGSEFDSILATNRYSKIEVSSNDKIIISKEFKLSGREFILNDVRDTVQFSNVSKIQLIEKKDPEIFFGVPPLCGLVLGLWAIAFEGLGSVFDKKMDWRPIAICVGVGTTVGLVFSFQKGGPVIYINE